MGVGGVSASITRSLKSSSGAAAKRSGSAPSTWKFKSGMRGVLLQSGEELGDLVPHRGAARQAAPVRSDQADQLVAHVDAHAEIGGLGCQTVDQQRLHIRFQ